MDNEYQQSTIPHTTQNDLTNELLQDDDFIIELIQDDDGDLELINNVVNNNQQSIIHQDVPSEQWLNLQTNQSEDDFLPILEESTISHSSLQTLPQTTLQSNGNVRRYNEDIIKIDTTHLTSSDDDSTSSDDSSTNDDDSTSSDNDTSSDDEQPKQSFKLLNLNDPENIGNVDFYQISKYIIKLTSDQQKIIHHKNPLLKAPYWCLLCEAPIIKGPNHTEQHLNYLNALSATTPPNSCTKCCLRLSGTGYQNHINSPYCSNSDCYCGTLAELIGYQVNPFEDEETDDDDDEDNDDDDDDENGDEDDDDDDENNNGDNSSNNNTNINRTKSLLPFPNCPSLDLTNKTPLGTIIGGVELLKQLHPLREYGFTTKAIESIITPIIPFKTATFYCTICLSIVPKNNKAHLSQHSNYLYQNYNKINHKLSCTSCYLTFGRRDAYHDHLKSSICRKNVNYIGPLDNLIQQIDNQNDNTTSTTKQLINKKSKSTSQLTTTSSTTMTKPILRTTSINMKLKNNLHTPNKVKRNLSDDVGFDDDDDDNDNYISSRSNSNNSKSQRFNFSHQHHQLHNDYNNNNNQYELSLLTSQPISLTPHPNKKLNILLQLIQNQSHELRQLHALHEQQLREQHIQHLNAVKDFLQTQSVSKDDDDDDDDGNDGQNLQQYQQPQSQQQHKE